MLLTVARPLSKFSTKGPGYEQEKKVFPAFEGPQSRTLSDVVLDENCIVDITLGATFGFGVVALGLVAVLYDFVGIKVLLLANQRLLLLLLLSGRMLIFYQLDILPGVPRLSHVCYALSPRG